MHTETKLRSNAQENRELVRRFFHRYPFSGQEDCATFTGLSRATVNRHFQALRIEQEEKRRADA